MSIERPANERLALYERFKQSLAKGNDDEFFDADDLIIIIDQAVDLEDEYVEIEAIMRGYRFFPDNEELASRRAFLYYDLNLDEGVDNMRSRLPEDSPMTRILSMRRMENSGNEEMFTEMLDGIVNAPGMLDDETIIQLVDCASACGCYKWVKENEKKLRAKTDYLPTLLYEIFIVADIQGDHSYSINLLEELTDLEPFNIDFWNALAQVQALPAHDGSDADLDAALTSIDFALAIDSDNAQALTLKASILLQQGNAAAAADTLTPLADKMPQPTACEIYIRALYELDRIDEANRRLEAYCRQYADSRELIGLALAVDRPMLPRILALHFEAVKSQPDADKDWFEWAGAYYREGHLREAVRLFEVLYKEQRLSYQGHKLYFTALYCMGDYATCIERLDNIIEVHPEMLMPDIVIAGIMSYLQRGDKKAARKAMKRLMEHFPMTIKEDWKLSSNLESIGMSHFISAVQATLESGGPINTAELDIFRFPNTKSPQQ